MTPRQQQRLLFAVILFVCALIATSIVLYALRQDISLYCTPSDLRQHPQTTQAIRLGGMVKLHSIQHVSQSTLTRFVLTDNQSDIVVEYAGVLPDLFREQQAVVAEGKLVGPKFIASQVLAKHDEKYMPKEVADALKRGQVVKKNN
jgi:cytochrome c-type biogenesis protein CcmE